jgi:hypothetical protein
MTTRPGRGSILRGMLIALLAALKFVADFQESVAQYPNIKTGEEFTGYV